MEPRSVDELEDFLLETPSRFDVVGWRVGPLDLWPLFVASILNLRIQAEIGQRKSHTTVGSLPWKVGVLSDYLILSPLQARFQKQPPLPPDDLDDKMLFHASRLHGRRIGPLLLFPTIDIPAVLMMRQSVSPVVWLDDVSADSPELPNVLIDTTRGLGELTAAAHHMAHGVTVIRLERLPGLARWISQIASLLGTSAKFMNIWVARVVGKALHSASLYARIFAERGTPHSVIMTNCGFANTVGLTASAKALSVPVIEIQHGAESRSSITSRSHSIHFSKFNTAPDALVSWELEQPFDEKTLAIGPIGLLIPDLVEQLVANDPRNCQVLRTLLARQKNSLANRTDREIARHVLVSLQPGDRGEWLAPIVEDMTDTFFWVRRHGADSKLKAESIAVSRYNRVDTDIATTTLLPVLITHCDVHLTRFSAVVLEAAALGVTSVVTEPYAIQLYSEKVPRRLLSHARHPTEIIAAIIQSTKRYENGSATIGATDQLARLTTYLMVQSRLRR